MIPEQTKLNLGCGYQKLNDHWNVDIDPNCNPDEIWDLDVTPYPWDENFFTEIHMNNVLEHLGQSPKVFAKIMQELYRISADKAIWTIIVPHQRCDVFWDDFTHVRAITEKGMVLFDQQRNYEVVQKKLSESTFGFSLGVDLEKIAVDYDIVDYWKKQVQEGMIGSQQLNINLNTMSNVAVSMFLKLKVHKPGRYVDWLKAFTK